MEENKPPPKTSPKDTTNSLNKITSTPNPNPNYSQTTPTFYYSSRLVLEKTKKPSSLVTMCLEIVGKHLEDIVQDLGDIAVCFPPHIKMAITAIARRRRLLDDDVLVALADSSWEIVDVSGSDVTDSGLAKVAEICKFLRALDISRCSKITAAGVSELVQHCKSLQTLRCGGCPMSNYTARHCLNILKPELDYNMDGDSWEELDTAEIGHGAASLRWLVWPMIDKDSTETLATECPRIVVNPTPSPLGFRGVDIPVEALPDHALDNPFVKELNPETWSVLGFMPKVESSSFSGPTELSKAERFRLAFEERDTRLAPKRAKNARQHQRRAERELVLISTRAKAIALAAKASKSLYNRN